MHILDQDLKDSNEVKPYIKPGKIDQIYNKSQFVTFFGNSLTFSI